MKNRIKKMIMSLLILFILPYTNSHAQEATSKAPAGHSLTLAQAKVRGMPV